MFRELKCKTIYVLPTYPACRTASTLIPSTLRRSQHFPMPLVHTSWHSFCHTACTSCLSLKQGVRKRAPWLQFFFGEFHLLGRRDGLILNPPGSLTVRWCLHHHEVITSFIWQGNNYWTSSAAVTVSWRQRPFNCRALVFVNMYFRGKAQE